MQTRTAAAQDTQQAFVLGPRSDRILFAVLLAGAPRLAVYWRKPAGDDARPGVPAVPARDAEGGEK